MKASLNPTQLTEMAEALTAIAHRVRGLKTTLTGGGLESAKFDLEADRAGGLARLDKWVDQAESDLDLAVKRAKKLAPK